MSKVLGLTLAGLTIIFSSCSTVKKVAATNKETTMQSDNISNKKWELIELFGKEVSTNDNQKRPVLQFNKAENSFHSTTDCNGFFGEFKAEENGKIAFSKVASTMMACTTMALQDGLSKVYQEADNYTVNNGVLSLNKGRVAPLARFKAVETIAQNQQLEGTWELDYISGSRIAFDGLFPNKKPTITFNTAENKAHGNGSCNNFKTTYTVNQSEIKFAPVGATRMACPGSGNGEASFFNTLSTVTKFSVDGKTLNLIMGDIAVMRFQKK